MREFSFAAHEFALRRAASEGAFAAAETFAAQLASDGHAARATLRLDGVATVILEGAGAVAREFGTRSTPAKPILGLALQTHRARLIETMARAITGVLK